MILDALSTRESAVQSSPIAAEEEELIRTGICILVAEAIKDIFEMSKMFDVVANDVTAVDALGTFASAHPSTSVPSEGVRLHSRVTWAALLGGDGEEDIRGGQRRTQEARCCGCGRAPSVAT